MGILCQVGGTLMKLHDMERIVHVLKVRGNLPGGTSWLF